MQYANGAFKTICDTEGYKHDCPDYDPCPLCYGCRNAGMHPNRCNTLCMDNPKKNVCNVELHTPENISKMVRRQIITLKEEIS